MIGQQKRPLEVAVSPVPMKFLKNTDFSRYKETINGLKPDAENFKTSFLETHSLTELKPQLLRDESLCDEEAKKALLGKQVASPSVYHEGSTANKQQELSRINFTPERTDPFGSFRSLVHPTHLLWLSSPSRHILDQGHEADEPCTTVTLESHDEMFHDHFSNERMLHRRKVPIGPDFQAHVPVWEARKAPFVAIESSGVAEGRDENNESRWLGLQVWPLPGCKKLKDESRIGKGRTGFCSCIHRGSVECIQMHVHEKTIRLKMELGKAFQLLGFDEMGERVSEQWMEEDEHRFKMLVKLNPVSLGRNFWHMLPFAFPTKTTRDFLSYYFNVFVLRRRAIQNRFDPENIDSDDDECELTSSDTDDSDGYETDEESGEFEEDESDEDKAEDDWEEATENKTKKVLEAPRFLNSELTSSCHCSSVYEGQCLGHHDTTNGSADLVPSTKGTSASIFNSSHESMQNSLSLSLSEWNHDLQIGGKHSRVSNQSMGADDLQGDKNWDEHHWMQINHTPERDLHLKLRSPYELELSPYVKELNFSKDHPSLMQRSSLETCNPDLWVGYMDIIPRKSVDKLISTTGLITELFGDGNREADIEKKVSGHRLSSFISHGWSGERE